jgi:hypothetical protein
VAELAHFHLEIAEDILFLLGGEKLLLPALSLLAPAAPAHHTHNQTSLNSSAREYSQERKPGEKTDKTMVDNISA